MVKKPPHKPTPPDTGPPERRQHVELITDYVPVLGRLTREANSTVLDEYWDRGYLRADNEQPEAGTIRWQAGNQFRDDFEAAAIHGTVTASLERVDGGRQEMTEKQVAARQRYRKAVRDVGKINAVILERVCVWGERINVVETKMRWRVRWGMPRLWEALDELARHYGTICDE